VLHVLIQKPWVKFSLKWSDFSYTYTAISIKVVHEQSGKVEYERERPLGITLKIH
jgi:hypothetical protein